MSAVRRLLRIAFAAGAALACAGFLALGIWQVERRTWKLDLIERVEQRVRAPATPVSSAGPWPPVNAADDEYRHVQLTGRFLHEHETLVQATTAIGAGFWVLTPLALADGRVVLVNRGFVPPEARERASRTATAPQGDTNVSGLLRLPEPRGAFLRRNDPATGRWHSRDVEAIAATRDLDPDRVAPFFVDQDAAPAAAAQAWPVGGLTVVAFPNNHLVYALTWFGLALIAALAAWRVMREEPPDAAPN